MISSRNNSKKNLDQKSKKKLGVPLAFPSILTQKNLFKFSSYYDWNLSMNSKNDWRRCLLLHSLFNPPPQKKARIETVMFAEWAEQAFESEPCHLPEWAF